MPFNAVQTSQMRLRFVLLLSALAWSSGAHAATKDEYRAASVDGLREEKSFGRAKVMVAKVLAAQPGQPIVGTGRGEISFVSRLLLAGRPTRDPELLGLARDIVLTCNRVAVDGYDTPQQNNLEQVGYSLRELSLAVSQLKELKLLEGPDAARADETLKRACDFLLRYMPEPNDGNIPQRYALGVATVCRLFPEDPRVSRWKAWAALPYEQVLRFPSRDGLPGARRSVLEKQGARWKFVPDVRPFERVRSVDISEDSSGYEASTIVSWMGIARLLGREEEIKTPAVEAFIDRFYQQQMPVGVLPAYGDANWNGAPELWIAIFEWAGATFRQPKYRAAADAIFRYQLARRLSVGDLSEAAEYADESLPPAEAPRGSLLLRRISGRGEVVPDKVILRADASQAYVMMQATESLGHSHPHAGSISAYGVGDAVLLSTLGYDATATPLHQSFIVRPADEKFLDFFGDPRNTLLGKIMPDGRRLTSIITSDVREVRSAEVRADAQVAYGKVVCDYLTAWQKQRDFNGHAFEHTREIALDQASGLLCVRDTVVSKGDVTAAFGPVWHVQRVLAKNDSGFLCQTDYQDKVDGKVDGGKPRPVWVAMAGPSDVRLNDVFWRFSARHGHSELPHEHHLTSEWRGKVAAGQKLSFVTVFLPLPEGAREPVADLTISFEGGRPVVQRGGRVYAFPDFK